MNTPTPRTDESVDNCAHYQASCDMVEAEFARQLEREITELNERLIDRQKTLMAALTENQNLRRELDKANQ